VGRVRTEVGGSIQEVSRAIQVVGGDRQNVGGFTRWWAWSYMVLRGCGVELRLVMVSL